MYLLGFCLSFHSHCRNVTLLLTYIAAITTSLPFKDNVSNNRSTNLTIFTLVELAPPNKKPPKITAQLHKQMFAFGSWGVKYVASVV